jgi:hypothetical protein
MLKSIRKGVKRVKHVYLVNVNPDENGYHEVHRSDCKYKPKYPNGYPLTPCNNCHEALDQARRLYDKVDGCGHCSKECHER